MDNNKKKFTRNNIWNVCVKWAFVSEDILWETPGTGWDLEKHKFTSSNDVRFIISV